MGLFRKKIGLALGGGGAKGLAHIGVIQVLVENNISIDYISGTSIGALIGGLYAVTKDIHVIENLFASQKYKSFIRSIVEPSLTSGILKGENILEMFSDYIDESTMIEDTQIPFVAVASDLKGGGRYLFKDGSLKTAIRGSISLPLILDPLPYKGMLLVDGALTEIVPIKAVKEIGAQKVIGVNLYNNFFPKEFNDKKLSALEVFNNCIDLFQFNQSKSEMLEANVAINIPIKRIPLSALTQDPSEYIELGRKAALDEIKKLKLL